MSRFSAAIANIVSGCGAIGEKCCREGEIASLAARRAKGRANNYVLGRRKLNGIMIESSRRQIKDFAQGFRVSESSSQHTNSPQCDRR